jgi:hypothetical protein
MPGSRMAHQGNQSGTPLTRAVTHYSQTKRESSTWGHRFSDSAIVGKGKTARMRSGVRKLTLALVGLCFADPTLTDLSQIHFG